MYLAVGHPAFYANVNEGRNVQRVLVLELVDISKSVRIKELETNRSPEVVYQKRVFNTRQAAQADGVKYHKDRLDNLICQMDALRGLITQHKDWLKEWEA